MRVFNVLFGPPEIQVYLRVYRTQFLTFQGCNIKTRCTLLEENGEEFSISSVISNLRPGGISLGKLCGALKLPGLWCQS